MPIALVNDDRLSNGSHASAVLSGFVVSSGANRILLAFVIDAAVGAVTGISSDVDGSLGAAVATVSQTGAGVKAFVLVNPTADTHELTVSHSDSNATGTTIFVAEYTGVDQVSPIGTPQTSGGTGTTASVTVTTAAGQVIVDCIFSGQDTTQGADQNDVQDTFNSTSSFHSEYTEQAGADGGVMSYTIAFSATYALLAFPLLPAGGGKLVNGGRVNRGSRVGGSLVSAFQKAGNLFVPDRRILRPADCILRPRPALMAA